MAGAAQSSDEKHEESKRVLRLEALEAIGRKRRCTPDLSWLISQCSTVSSDDESIFELSDNGDTTAVRFLDKQTYKQWKAHFGFQRMVHPWRMRQKTIVLQPISCNSLPSGYSLSEIDAFLLQGLKKFCEAFFINMHIRTAETIDLSQMGKLTSRVHPDTNREQFLVGDVMKYLKSHQPREAYCVLGITLVDLYPDSDSNFVLGHASLTDGCAVASFGRHFNSCLAVDGPDGVNLQFQNLWVVIRVVTHELCHTFGLKHCYYFKCAMNRSSSIEQAAAQPLFLCPVCSRKLQKALNFNLVTWYAALAQSCRQVENEIKRAMGRSEETRVQDRTSDGVHSVGCRLQDSNQSNYSSHPATPDLSLQDSDQSNYSSHPAAPDLSLQDSDQSNYSSHPTAPDLSLQDSDQSNYSSHPAAPYLSHQQSSNSLPPSVTQGGKRPAAPYLQYLEQAIGWIDRANLSIARHFKP